MARQPFDAFLPSGAAEPAHYYPSPYEPRFAAVAPPIAPPRGFQDHIPSQVAGGRSRSPRPCASPPFLVLSPHQRQATNAIPPDALAINQPRGERPLSPPFSRTSSTEESRSAQAQRWRLFTQHLRETAQGERAHMEADRARLEEVMAEERALWEEEREYLKSRIEQLESQLAAISGRPNPHRGQYEFDSGADSVPMAQSGQGHHPDALPSGNTGTNGFNRTIPQESGRNPDGSPFYAPASRNPSRTFDETQNNDLRVDSMSAPRETPLRVTSKELKQSDFGPQSAPAETTSRDRLDGSVGSESIDISHLQPELEGVPIKASAVAPEFAAKVLSPNSSLSPSKPCSSADSPTTRRDPSWNPDGSLRSNSQPKRSTLEIIAAPETHRLTMNAGHTPNHSIHKIELGDSGNATPTQSHHQPHGTLIVPGLADLRVNENIDPDPELRGPLGLRNDAPKDEIFLTTLTDKLNEIKDGRGMVSGEAASQVLQGAVSSVLSEKKQNGSSSVTSPIMDDDESEQAVDEAPVLRVKASMNFGRPFGSL